MLNAIDLQQTLMSAPAILFAIAFHEFSHGYVAWRLGDGTARAMGRLTLNPLKHLDPIGTITLLLFGFGWARPVPINPMNFRNPTRDMVISSLAGPASNFATAIAAAAIVRLVVVLHLGGFVVMLAYSFVMVNLFFGVFNLLPIPPLDGWRLLHYFMPPSSAYAVEVFVARYGILVMFGLMLIAPFLARLVAPVATVIGHLLIGA